MIGANVTNRKAADAGLILADTIRELLSHWNFVPNGLSEVGECVLCWIMLLFRVHNEVCACLKCFPFGNWLVFSQHMLCIYYALTS